MNTEDKLMAKARYWYGVSFNDYVRGRRLTPMVTIEMTQSEWDSIWKDDPAPDMYKALNDLYNHFVHGKGRTSIILPSVERILAKVEGVE